MILQKLCQIANQLDSQGLYVEANVVDHIMRSAVFRGLPTVRLSPENIQSILSKHGMQYVGPLSAGAQGVVSEAQMDGQKVAAKIILPSGFHPNDDSENTSDYQKVSHEKKVWDRIQNLAISGALNDIQVSYQDEPINGTRHLPKIFLNTTVPAEDSPIGQPYAIIVMEMLVPFSKVFGNEKYKEFRQETFMQTKPLGYEKIVEALEYATQRYKEIKGVEEGEKSILNPAALTPLLKAISDLDLNPTYQESVDYSGELFTNRLIVPVVDKIFNVDASHRLFLHYDDEGKEYPPAFDIPRQGKVKIFQNIAKFFLYSLSRPLFPRYGWEYESGASKQISEKGAPGMESLFNTVDTLRQKGVKWADIKGNNLMIRPSTGEIVIIDAGLYELGPAPSTPADTTFLEEDV